MAPWPPASTGRLQQRQSQLAKSKQPQKHKTVSPRSVSGLHMTRRLSPSHCLLCFEIPFRRVAMALRPTGPRGETAWESGEAAGSASSFCHFCFGVGSLRLNLIKNHGGRSRGGVLSRTPRLALSMSHSHLSSLLYLLSSLKLYFLFFPPPLAYSPSSSWPAFCVFHDLQSFLFSCSRLVSWETPLFSDKTDWLLIKEWITLSSLCWPIQRPSSDRRSPCLTL